MRFVLAPPAPALFPRLRGYVPPLHGSVPPTGGLLPLVGRHPRACSDSDLKVIIHYDSYWPPYLTNNYGKGCASFKSLDWRGVGEFAGRRTEKAGTGRPAWFCQRCE